MVAFARCLIEKQSRPHGVEEKGLCGGIWARTSKIQTVMRTSDVLRGYDISSQGLLYAKLMPIIFDWPTHNP